MLRPAARTEVERLRTLFHSVPLVHDGYGLVQVDVRPVEFSSTTVNFSRMWAKATEFMSSSPGCSREDSRWWVRGYLRNTLVL